MNEREPNKRVELARDVIKQLKRGFYKSEAGTFIYVNEEYLTDEPDAKKFFENLLQREKTCSVCAKGALLISKILRDDKILMNQLGLDTWDDGAIESHNVFRNLKDFTKDELDEIEIAFEGKLFNSVSRRVGKSFDKIIAYYEKSLAHLNDKNRLIKIMRRVIRNKGSLGIVK